MISDEARPHVAKVGKKIYNERNERQSLQIIKKGVYKFCNRNTNAVNWEYLLFFLNR